MLHKTYLVAIFLNLTLIAGLVIPDLETILNFDQLLTSPLSIDKESENGALSSSSSGDVAPIISKASADQIIPDRYIIVFKDGLSYDQTQEHKFWVNKEYNGMVSQMSEENSGCHDEGEEVSSHNFKQSNINFFDIGEDLFKGYVGYFNDELIKKIQANPLVKFIEKDSIVKIDEFDVQKDSTWALSRLSHRDLSPSTEYLYDNEGGEGVTAYVIDTGIKVEHEEFGGRATWGDAVPFPHLKVDAHGHGTHCAGIIGSETYGVAKKVELVAVGVMNMLGSGTTSDIIKGIEFVVNEHKEKVSSKKKGFKGSTVNMSIGGGVSDALDLATNAGTKSGLHIAVAAGNENQDACEVSPARSSGPITVGASDNADVKASFSNWGGCVDIFAPGVDILSTFTWSETTLMSGTSMASPHIAGLLSYYLSLQPDINSEYATNGIIDPLALKSKILKYASKGLITGITDNDTPNLLAFNGAGGNLTDFWTS